MLRERSPLQISDATIAFVIVLLLLATYRITLRPGQDWGGDFSQYIAHARNLATGRPYAETTYVITPEAAMHMPNRYPPVFPVMLVPIYRTRGLDYDAMKWLVEALLAGTGLCVYLFARMRGLGIWPAASASVAFALSGLVLAVKDSIVSDSAYLFFSALTIVAVTWMERSEWDRTRSFMAALLVAIPMLLAYGSRAVGLSLALAFVATEVIRYRRVRLYGVLVASIFVAGVIASSLTLYDSRSYGNQFHVNISIYVGNIIYYLKSPALLWLGSPGAVRYALVALTMPLAIAAWLRRLFRDPSFAEFYMAAALAPLIVFITPVGRYILPVLLLYFVYVFEALEWIRERTSAQWIPAAMSALLILGVAANLRGMEKGPYAEGIEKPGFAETCAYLRSSISPNALVITWNPRVVALYTGRRTAWYPDDEPSAADLDRYLDRMAPDYVLVYLGAEPDRRELAPLIASESSHFEPAFQSGSFAVYRFIPGKL